MAIEQLSRYCQAEDATADDGEIALGRRLRISVHGRLPRD
jgi:hypothetical protein